MEGHLPERWGDVGSIACMVACHSDLYGRLLNRHKVWSLAIATHLPLLVGAADVFHRHSGECRYKVAVASDHTGADVFHRHSSECRYKVAMASDHTGADFPHQHS